MKNLENEFLASAIAIGEVVRIWLTNGFRFEAEVLAADEQTVLFKLPDGTQEMVYKHAISTIAACGRFCLTLDEG